jgi:hypothetical protein
MSTRVLVAAWCVVAVVVWSAVFDWWMHGATREYLLQVAEHELGRGPEPSLVTLMADARRSGVMRASQWAVLVAGAGFATLAVLRRSNK